MVIAFYQSIATIRLTRGRPTRTAENARHTKNNARQSVPAYNDCKIQLFLSGARTHLTECSHPVTFRGDPKITPEYTDKIRCIIIATLHSDSVDGTAILMQQHCCHSHSLRKQQLTETCAFFFQSFFLTNFHSYITVMTHLAESSLLQCLYETTHQACR